MYRIATRICLTGDIGISGNMFGGRMLEIMDESAAIYARIYTGGQRMVSRKFSGVEFRAPVKLGEILEIYAGNAKHGNTSLSFDVIVIAGETKRFQAECVFVATDEHGAKTPVDWSRAKDPEDKK